MGPGHRARPVQPGVGRFPVAHQPLAGTDRPPHGAGPADRHRAGGHRRGGGQLSHSRLALPARAGAGVGIDLYGGAAGHHPAQALHHAAAALRPGHAGRLHPYPQSWWTWDRGKAGGALPSGHAGAGYSLLALYFAGWAVGRPGWRWWGLAAGIAAGLAFSAVRILQGAHFLSQTLWSAALMWLLAALFFWPVLHGTGGRPASVSIAQLSSRPGSHSENAGT
ncbi:phosphatase PAP2 family protein [Achromobacter xylosoxidans]